MTGPDAGGLTLQQVTFRYPGADHDALTDMSLSCAPGTITWLYGALGAGCSTALLVSYGLAPAFTGGTLTGSVHLLGTDVATGRAALRGRVAFVTAVPALQLSGIAETVWEEVAFAPANLGWPIARIRAAVDAALDRLEVAHLAGRHPAAVSGGELQRIVIASLLALAPDAWLLDEPGSALDSAGHGMMQDILREEARRGALVVIASEDPDAMASLADRLVLLRDGSVAAVGAPRTLLAGPDLVGGIPGGTSAAALARAAEALAPCDLLAPPYPITVEDAVARWA